MRHFYCFALLLFSHGTKPETLLNHAERSESSLADTGLSTRTLQSIILGCFSATIFVTWAAVHPNASGIINVNGPAPVWRNLRRFFDLFWIRLQLLFWNFVAPELIIAWSVRQWFAAQDVAHNYTDDLNPPAWVVEGKVSHLVWEVRKLFSDRNLKKKYMGPNLEWTMAHGHLVAMGGITLIIDPSTPDEREILTPERLKDLIHNRQIDFPAITASEIADRSKHDVLAKLLAIFQSLWFILQCIARRIQALDITQLEISTIAVVVISLFSYICWWTKPLSLQEPFKIYLKRDSDGRMTQGSPAINSPDPDTNDLYNWYITDLARNTFALFNRNSIPDDKKFAPNFYSPHTVNGVYARLIAFSLLGALLGGLHCIPWNFTYPTRAELILWRATSLFIAISPSFISLIDFILYKIHQGASNATTGPPTKITPEAARVPRDKDQESCVIGGMSEKEQGISAVLSQVNPKTPKARGRIVSQRVLEFIMVVLLYLYVLSRLSLFLQSLYLLRRSPPGVFLTVTWTKFIPHIGTFA